MKIAALYARVSSAKQQLNENIASQIAAIEEYARQNDFQISPHHVYKDDGFSGARLDRPALDRLRDAVAQGEVEAVLILSPDRLARQFAYQYIVVEEFERAGCAIVFTSHNFGSSPADRMLQEMTGVFADAPALDVMLAAGARAVQSTPLVSRSGHVLGMFSTHYRAPSRASEHELRQLDVLARQAADFINLCYA
jgi:Resolvase, N terminal domain/GAF domain